MFAERPVCRIALLLVLVTLIITVMPAASGAQPACQPDGDVDQNGSLTAADALLAFRQALGLSQLRACQQTIADVSPEPADPDGSITASDALCIFQKALGLPSCLDALPASNLPPVADAGADQSVDAGVMVFLLGTGSDPDGTIASHAWTQTGGTTVSLTGADAATAVFVAPDVSVDETLTFRLTVTDDAGSQASDEVMVTVHAVAAPPDQASAEEVFRQHISGPVVQTKCVNCHVANGASGHTRLVFVRSTDTPDHEAQNLQTFENFLAVVADEGGGSYVLNKIQGVGHGGGVQVSPGTTEFASMQRFLGLLGEEVAPPAPVTVETLFDTVLMASPRKTLWRAALILAGRVPTDAEYAAVEAGDESVLRATIRGLMTGEAFHEFLIRGSNDRLLIARDTGDLLNNPSLVDFTNEDYRRSVAVYEGVITRQEHWHWVRLVRHGVRQAPLQLIAYVAANDLPYTDILTADYVMANPWAADAYGASTRFDDPADPHEFRPSRIVNYYRKGEGFKTDNHPVTGFIRVVDPGPLLTIFPHAGILNTISFLNRYPTTATNRNRARARWTYYHFLGVDVEKSASRTTDPVALADTSNPTMHNPACTVCHSVLDPVAGAFQNYSDDGHYKWNLGGVDSLDELYKGGGPALAIQAESWAQRETLVWKVTLSTDVGSLRVMFINNFYDQTESGHVYLDRLDVVDIDGRVVASHEFEDLGVPTYHDGGRCGQARSSQPGGANDHVYLWGGWFSCAFYIDVNVPSTGAYDVEIVAWSDGRDDRYLGDVPFAEISVVANGYEEGDIWYRDMRAPGFDGAAAPDTDNSVQWLARRIVADDRFAEATIRFWWPAIMGREIAEFPDEAADADFEGRLLAANAQDAEVVRLAADFRNGFHGGLAYNLKDLLTEIVLSKWFRTDTLTDADPVRRTALRYAGAKRLLTPEELARKTAAITGVQWGRRNGGSEFSYTGPWLNALTDEYRMLYGGIDSEGITERARDLTSVMAGVASRHAVEVACPVVLREFYLLPDAKRRLFAGIKRTEGRAAAVKAKLVELHDKLLGIQLTEDSADVEAAYRLFDEVSTRGKKEGGNWFDWWRCSFNHDHRLLDGILDNVVVRHENEGWWWHELDHDRVRDLMSGTDFSDPHHTAQAWAVVLTAMMMDYRYLYL